VALLEEQIANVRLDNPRNPAALYCRLRAMGLQRAIDIVDPIDCDEAPRDLTPPKECLQCCECTRCDRWQPRVEIADASEEE